MRNISRRMSWRLKLEIAVQGFFRLLQGHGECEGVRFANYHALIVLVRYDTRRRVRPVGSEASVYEFDLR